MFRLVHIINILYAIADKTVYSYMSWKCNSSSIMKKPYHLSLVFVETTPKTRITIN